MSTFVLVALIFTNNTFYGKDAIPTLEFKLEKYCVDFVKQLKQTNTKTEYICIEKKG